MAKKTPPFLLVEFHSRARWSRSAKAPNTSGIGRVRRRVRIADKHLQPRRGPLGASHTRTVPPQGSGWDVRSGVPDTSSCYKTVVTGPSHGTEWEHLHAICDWIMVNAGRGAAGRPPKQAVAIGYAIQRGGPQKMMPAIKTTRATFIRRVRPTGFPPLGPSPARTTPTTRSAASSSQTREFIGTPCAAASSNPLVFQITGGSKWANSAKRSRVGSNRPWAD